MFVSIAQLFYGQEKYTIQGEFPDNSRLGNLNSLNIYALLIQDAFLSWWDYIIKEREFKRKSRIILDSLIGDPPRFIETIPSSSSSTTVKNE